MVVKKGWLRHLDFIVVDVIALEFSLLITAAMYPFIMLPFQEVFWNLFLFLPFVHVFSALILDAYNEILRRGYLVEMGALLKLESLNFCILIFFFYFLKLFAWLPQMAFVFYFALCTVITYAARVAHKRYLRKRYQDLKYSRQIVVITTKAMAEKMVRSIVDSVIGNYQFFGLVILDESMVGERIEHITVDADRNSLVDYMQNNVVDEVFLNLPDDSQTTMKLAEELLMMGITVHIYMENVYQELPNRSISKVFGYNVLTTTISPISFRQSLEKRIFDIAGGIVGCAITLILYLIIAPVIYLKSPGPILFSQIRIGKNGRPFKLYKFRSMYMDAEARKEELMKQNKIESGLMFKMDNDPRIIKGIGTFIRKTSIDEFPQFFNVLKGDMSMVGTRPPTVDEYQRYSPHHKRRLSMKPGITGLWQISGRSQITDFEEVVHLDTQYIENWSIRQDIKIIWKTIFGIWKDKGAV